MTLTKARKSAKKKARRITATAPVSVLAPDSPAALLGIPESQVTYMLRTCDADRRAYHSFQWPESGLVICPDWRATKACGNGLHGLLHGDGDNSLLNWNDDALWLVVAIDRTSVVEIERKVKVPRGVVVFCGKRGEAVTKLLALDSEATPGKTPGGQASASGDRGQEDVTRRRVVSLLEAMRDNEPDDSAADAVTCWMLWKHEATQLLAQLAASPALSESGGTA